MQIGELQSFDTQVFLGHDLMQFTESPNHVPTSHDSGGSEVAGSADVVAGSADDMQDVLNDVWCDHESPMDQILVGSDNNEQQQPQQPPAESKCKRQHQPPAAEAAKAIVEAPAPALASTNSFRSQRRR